MTFRLDNNEYEYIHQFPVLKSTRFINNDSLNGSPSLFVQEQQGLVAKTPAQKLNLEGVEKNGLHPIPNWFRTDYQNLVNLGVLQEKQSSFPNSAEIPSGIIRQNLSTKPPENDVKITKEGSTALYSLINNLVKTT